MRSNSFRLLLSLLPLAVIGITSSGAAFAQVSATPSLLNFQGRLATPSGNPVPDGNYSIRFSLYTAATGGTKLWEQTINPVAVKNGTFAAALNVGANFQGGATAATLFNGSLFLEIKVGADAALTPRFALSSVAYAKKADSVADGSLTSASFAGGVVTPGGTAGGDLIGTYPNPELKTVASSLYKVSGTLMSALAGSASSVDQAQLTGPSSMFDSAWQSFTPSQNGNLTAIEIRIGTTTGVNKTIPIALYSGEGTGGTLLATRTVTVTPAVGFQYFELAAPVAVTGGQKYTWYIGRSASLQFGYAESDPYNGGRSDIGSTIDYAFRTYMTSGNSKVSVNADLITTGRIGVGTPAPSRELEVVSSGDTEIGIRSADSTGRQYTLQSGGNAAGNRFEIIDRTANLNRFTLLPSGNIGIGTIAPSTLLHVNGTGRFNGDLNAAGGLTATTAALSTSLTAPTATLGTATVSSTLNAGSTTVNGNLVVSGTSRIGNADFGSGLATSFAPGLIQFDAPGAPGGRLTILGSNGNVGIGTTTPQNALHVVGSLGQNDNLANGVHIGRDAGGNSRMELVTNGGVPYIDFNNQNVGDGKGRIFLNATADSTLNMEAPNVRLATAGGLLGYGNIIRWESAGEFNVFSTAVNFNGGANFKITGLPSIGDQRNVQWNQTTGQLGWDTSTRRHKRDIQPLQDDFLKLLQVEAKTYTRPWDRTRPEIGFIAEDLDALGLKRLVWYEEDGKTPNGLNYEKMVVYLTEIAKIQQKDIQTLQQQVETLNKQNAALTQRDARVTALEAKLAEMAEALAQMKAQPK